MTTRWKNGAQRPSLTRVADNGIRVAALSTEFKNRPPTSLLDAIGLRCRSRSVGASAVIDQGTHVYVGHARFKFCHKIPKSERQEEPDAQSLRE